MIMKGCVPWNPIYDLKDPCLRRDSNHGPLDKQARTETRISVISGWWVGNNEKLCAMEPHLRLERSLSQEGLKPQTAREAGQCLLLNPLSHHNFRWE